MIEFVNKITIGEILTFLITLGFLMVTFLVLRQTRKQIEGRYMADLIKKIITPFIGKLSNNIDFLKNKKYTNEWNLPPERKSYLTREPYLTFDLELTVKEQDKVYLFSFNEKYKKINKLIKNYNKNVSEFKKLYDEFIKRTYSRELYDKCCLRVKDYENTKSRYAEFRDPVNIIKWIIARGLMNDSDFKEKIDDWEEDWKFFEKKFSSEIMKLKKQEKNWILEYSDKILIDSRRIIRELIALRNKIAKRYGIISQEFKETYLN